MSGQLSTSSRVGAMGSDDSDTPRRPSPSTKAFAVALALAGIGFVLYPAIRPFSDERSMEGARAFASGSWVVAHGMAIVAFVLLAVGLYGLSVHLANTAMAGRARRAVVMSWVGIGLTLPYYGAEVFGLHAVGQTAVDRSDPALVDTMTHSIRWDVGIWFIIIGLVVLAVGVGSAASAVWRLHRPGSRWTVVPLAVAVALYIPQFAGSQPVRVAHGALIALGCWALGWALGSSTPLGCPAEARDSSRPAMEEAWK